MRLALAGLLLLSPMAATMGVQVVNFRFAFFAEAISHSAFAGAALGIVLGLSPRISMPLFALAMGLGIVTVQRRSLLSSDTVIGVVLSAVVAFGLAVVSRRPDVQRTMMRFLFGDILTITSGDIVFLSVLFGAFVVFQALAYNRLLYVGFHPVLAETHGIPTAVFQYLFAGFLSLVVILSVWWIGVLLVTGLLIIPAATARNLARSAGAMFWWSLAVGTSSAVLGLLISAHPAVRTATGATIVLVAFCWFLVSSVVVRWRK